MREFGLLGFIMSAWPECSHDWRTKEVLGIGLFGETKTGDVQLHEQTWLGLIVGVKRLK